jgi:hypothetical protein
MNLSMPNDDSDASEDVASEDDTSESFPNQVEDSETAALVTADPLANLKADLESLKAVFKSQNADFKSQLDNQKTKADFESQLNSQKTKADFEDQLGSLKADFESQLERQNAGIKSLKKFGLFSLKNSRRRLEDEGKKQVPPDTFSFLVCSKILSLPFVLGITVFIVQITIFGLLARDLISKQDSKRDSEENSNRLGIPANVETIVRVTQFLAIVITVLTQADLRTSLEQVNEGYSKDRIGEAFGEASCGKWWFAAACRFLEGAVGLVVTLLLILPVDNVFDLLLNFTAMECVSQLDDVAFFLAGTGYFGSKNAERSEEIDETTYPEATDEKKRRKILHVLLLVVVFIWTLAFWVVIVRRQKSNKYLCQKFFVYSTQTELIQSGVYNLKEAKRNNDRVQYIMYQKSAEESESAGVNSFGYCGEEAVWTFSSSGEPCENIKAQSAETRTFEITTTLSSPWFSDILVQLDPIQLLCFEGGTTLPTEVGNLAGLSECNNSVTRPCGSASARTTSLCSGDSHSLRVCPFLSSA